MQSDQSQLSTRETEFKRWRRKLLYATLPERLHAADAGAPEQSPQAMQVLTQALSADELVMRVAVLRALESCGAAATPALLGALEHPCFRTRMNAIAALGQVGDSRAVPPLGALMEERIGGGLMRRKGWINLSYFLGPALLLVLWKCTGVPFFLLFGVIVPVISRVGAMLKRRRRSQEMCCLAEALAGISSREPRSGAHALIPALEVAATDVVMQTAEARQTCRDLARSLDELTRASLPIAAEAPTPPRNLPIVSEAPLLDPGGLPHV